MTVVATARKLVCIAWQMLTTNEPCGFAIPLSEKAIRRILKLDEQW